jgi:hypothetical protein
MGVALGRRYEKRAWWERTAPSFLPQLYTEVFDCDEKGYDDRYDDGRAHNGIGRQTRTPKCFTQNVCDDAAKPDGPEDR